MGKQRECRQLGQRASIVQFGVVEVMLSKEQIYPSVMTIEPTKTAQIGGMHVTTQQEPLNSAVSRFRIDAIDVARFIALVGMMGVHIWVSVQAPYSVNPLWFLSGKAAALFAVLAGVGIALSSQRLLKHGALGAARWNVFGRGLALVVIGLSLALVPSSAIVILFSYGLMFWLVIPAFNWSPKVLLSIAIVWALIWPVCSYVLRAALGQQPFTSPDWSGLVTNPLGLLASGLLNGHYPALTWVVYPLVGLAVGKMILLAHSEGKLERLGRKMVFYGVTVSVGFAGVSAFLLGPLGGATTFSDPNEPEVNSLTIALSNPGGKVPTDNWWWLASPASHSGTSIDLGITTGIALAVLGLCLAFGPILSKKGARLFAAAGAAPLTVYTVHVLTLTIFPVVIAVAFLGGQLLFNPGMTEPDPEFARTLTAVINSPLTWAIHIAIAIWIGARLAAKGRRGPLERLVAWTGRYFANRGRRSQAPERGRKIESSADKKAR